MPSALPATGARKDPGRVKRDRWITAIGVLKLLKTALLVAVGVGAILLMHKDVEATIGSWIAALGGDPYGDRFFRAMSWLSGVDEKKLEAIGIGSFIYAAVFAAEGVGLILAKRWAEYLTLIVTISFVPFEVYELVQRFTAVRVAALVLNLAVVAYICAKLRRDRRG